MRALVWIVEDTWEATVAEAAAFLPADTEVTLLHVAPGDVETLAEGSRHGLLGRRHRPPHEPPEPLRAISHEAAQALLVEARERFGREAGVERRRGRVEREVVAAAEGMDVLVLARDGDHSRLGPHSLGPAARFVVDHAPCRVLLVWADAPPDVETIPPLPEHPPQHRPPQHR
jgi:nucleotide-binding universal stress UspA family protein